MKLLKYFFTLSVLFFSAGSILAQENTDKYLEGAVPEVNKRIIFSELIHLPNASKADIFAQTEKWIEGRYNSSVSRVVYKDYDSGMLVAFGSDTIVFKESFLSLDRTIMTYQLKLQVKDGECTVELEKINYAYGENEKFTAEEMISDKVALNKSKTKVVKGLQKWRYKTVDHIDALFGSIAESLAVLSPTNQPVVPAPVINTPKREKVVSMTPLTPATSNTTTLTASNKIKLPANIVELAGKSSLMISVNTDNGLIDTPLTNIEFGSVFGETTVTILVAYGSEIYAALEKANNYTISIFETGLEDPNLVISCTKIASQTITPESISDSELREKLGVFALQKLYIGKVVNLQTK